LYSTFISSICASMHNHLVEPGVEGRKVTSHLAACMCDHESFKNMLTIVSKSIFITKIQFEFG
jgi:hypothetical protein